MNSNNLQPLTDLFTFPIPDGAIVKSTFTSHTAWVTAVAWSHTNQYHFMSGSYDKLVKLWDTRRSVATPVCYLTGATCARLCIEIFVRFKTFVWSIVHNCYSFHWSQFHFIAFHGTDRS